MFNNYKFLFLFILHRVASSMTMAGPNPENDECYPQIDRAGLRYLIAPLRKQLCRTDQLLGYTRCCRCIWTEHFKNKIRQYNMVWTRYDHGVAIGKIPPQDPTLRPPGNGPIPLPLIYEAPMEAIFAEMVYTTQNRYEKVEIGCRSTLLPEQLRLLSGYPEDTASGWYTPFNVPDHTVRYELGCRPWEKFVGTGLAYELDHESSTGLTVKRQIYTNGRCEDRSRSDHASFEPRKRDAPYRNPHNQGMIEVSSGRGSKSICLALPRLQTEDINDAHTIRAEVRSASQLPFDLNVAINGADQALGPKGMINSADTTDADAYAFHSPTASNIRLLAGTPDRAGLWHTRTIAETGQASLLSVPTEAYPRLFDLNEVPSTSSKLKACTSYDGSTAANGPEISTFSAWTTYSPGSMSNVPRLDTADPGP